MKLLAAVLAISIAACTSVQSVPPPMTSSASTVRLSVERVSEGVVRLALDNGEPHSIGYNLCPSGLERRIGATWTAVPSSDICTMQLMTLNPGADATFEKKLPPNLPAGEYRFVTSVESPLGTTQTGVTSEPFTLP